MFDNLDDPQKQMMLALAAGLLSPVRGRGMSGFGESLSNGLRSGLLGYNSARESADRRKQRELAEKMQRMQLDELEQGQQFKAALRGGYQPAVPASQAFAPTDMEMPSQFSPAKAPGMDFSKAMQVDPMRTIQAQNAYQQMTAKQGPQYKEVAGRLVAIGPDNGVKEVYAPPEKPQYKVGELRHYKAGRFDVTDEWDGTRWVQKAKSAVDKPEGPEKGPAAPQGYRFTQEGNLQAIPGGPADTKAGEKAEALAKRQEGALARADSVLEATNKALENTGYFTAGIGSVGLRSIPGTAAYNLTKTVDEIKANIGFSELQAMREASPTGGALGQVAVQELNMLQSVLGSLDTGQSPAQLSKTLEKVSKHYQNWKRAVVESKREQSQSDQPSGGFRVLGVERQ